MGRTWWNEGSIIILLYYLKKINLFFSPCIHYNPLILLFPLIPYFSSTSRKYFYITFFTGLATIYLEASTAAQHGKKSSNYSQIIASPLIHTRFSGVNYDDNFFFFLNTHLEVNPTRIGAMVSNSQLSTANTRKKVKSKRQNSILSKLHVKRDKYKKRL